MAITFHPNGDVTGTSASNFGSSGSVIQAKHLQFTTDLNGTAQSTTDLSGFSLSITPTSASNDIIIILHATMGFNCDGRMGLKRNGTEIVEHLLGTPRSPYIEHDVGTFCGTYKDSPNSTSAVTYQVTVKVTGCGYNYHINESTSGSTDNGRSGMTLLEVKA